MDHDDNISTRIKSHLKSDDAYRATDELLFYQHSSIERVSLLMKAARAIADDTCLDSSNPATLFGIYDRLAAQVKVDNGLSAARLLTRRVAYSLRSAIAGGYAKRTVRDRAQRRDVS